MSRNPEIRENTKREARNPEIRESTKRGTRNPEIWESTLKGGPNPEINENVTIAKILKNFLSCLITIFLKSDRVTV